MTAPADKILKIYSEKNPEKIKWKELSVEYVIESTGRFTEKATANVRITIIIIIIIIHSRHIKLYDLCCEPTQLVMSHNILMTNLTTI